MRKDASEIILSICSSLSLNLTVFIKYSKVNNLENNRVISRKRYSQLVCLALGFISPNLLTLKDDEKIEAMQFTVHILNDAFRKYHSDFFEGIDLKPNDQDGYSKLNADICKWYAENCNNKSERKIAATGGHLFYCFIKLTTNPLPQKSPANLTTAGLLSPINQIKLSYS